jgi:two-component system sensor histidine kinase/response regulator
LFIVDYDTPAGGGFKFIEAIRNNKKIVKMPKLIMLLPMMRVDLFDRLNKHGIDMGIGKPIIPSILLNGILDIFNLKAVSAVRTSKNLESVQRELENSHLVLLAEDNKTNQLIARSLLEEVGIEVVVANNGKEAVELYEKYKESIGLILIDLHMPVMNGYEAAEKIRELSNKVPIVAMTADVILGVRDKCAESGIYHYISKPFNPDNFIQTIKDIFLENTSDASEDTSILDLQTGLRNMGDNKDLYLQVLREYRRENQDTLDRFKAAVREKRYADATQIVHKVKSSSGSIGAKSIQEVAASLQKALEEEKSDEILPLKNRFVKLLEKLLEELESIQENSEVGVG